jgi:hypothetical protein
MKSKRRKVNIVYILNLFHCCQHHSAVFPSCTFQRLRRLNLSCTLLHVFMIGAQPLCCTILFNGISWPSRYFVLVAGRPQQPLFCLYPIRASSQVIKAEDINHWHVSSLVTLYVWNTTIYIFTWGVVTRRFACTPSQLLGVVLRHRGNFPFLLALLRLNECQFLFFPLVCRCLYTFCSAFLR